MNYEQSIQHIHPDLVFGKDFIVNNHNGDISIAWYTDTVSQPTQAEIEAAWVELQSLEYRRKRASEYPSIGDQLDALYKARGGDTAEIEALDADIQAVKEKYPKTK